jgi:hypothetical protein
LSQLRAEEVNSLIRLLSSSGSFLLSQTAKVAEKENCRVRYNHASGHTKVPAVPKKAAASPRKNIRNRAAIRTLGVSLVNSSPLTRIRNTLRGNLHSITAA